MIDLLLAAEDEGVPADHIAADLALPLAILIFSGSVFLLLWSILGWKKGALVYGTAFFGFLALMGVFWWFGAPGTPVALGPQNFPGQPVDEYQPKWFPFEAGSERSEFFPVTQGFADLEGDEAVAAFEERFQTPRQYLGLSPDASAEGDERLSSLQGDMDQVSGEMIEQFLPTDDAGTVLLGQNRRAEVMQAAGEPRADEQRADPFLTPRVAEVRLVEDAGHRVAAARLQTIATFQQLDDEGSVVDSREVLTEEGIWFAFKDPGALWFPSAVITVIALILFGLCIYGLDRVEQREKRQRREEEQAEEPVDVPAGVG